MNSTLTPASRKTRLRNTVLRGLFLYALFPILSLVFLSQPIGEAVRSADAAAFLMLLGVGLLVCLNWVIYTVRRKRWPSLLVAGYGVFCLLLFVIVEYASLPAYLELASNLAMIGGCLALTHLFLLSYWFAARHSKPAHVTAVGLWIIIGVTAALMLYWVIRDIEGRNVSLNTWINMVILAALIPATFARRILAACRRKAARRRATGLTEGRIIQIIGETRLDRDNDLVTDYHVRVQYTVDGIQYEIRPDIARLTMDWFGKKAFINRKIDVHYDPEHPDFAFTDPIDRRFISLSEDEEAAEDEAPY